MTIFGCRWVRPNAARVLLLGSLLASVPAARAEEGSTARIYRTREEQREVGTERRITSWLAASGLAEIEWLGEFLALDGDDLQARQASGSLQLALIATPLAYASGEVILEYDTDTDRIEVDEASASIEWDPVELELGRQFLPFGVYFSRFVSGPLLEFGETRGDGITISYARGDRWDLSLSGYHGRAHHRDDNSGRWDWSAALETFPWDTLALGLSYQSDLADSEAELLADQDNRYARAVAGASAYVSWLGERFDMSAEVLAATRSFRELEDDRNRPWAWNTEFAYAIRSDLEVALRLEGSQELEDAPGFRTGIAWTWRIAPQASMTVEYLHGFYEGALATRDERPLQTSDRLAAILSVAF
ncbi:MAG: LbtU family siderophore porin [Gammaproteobacteria bacterium]